MSGGGQMNGHEGEQRRQYRTGQRHVNGYQGIVSRGNNTPQQLRFLLYIIHVRSRPWHD